MNSTHTMIVLCVFYAVILISLAVMWMPVFELETPDLTPADTCGRVSM